MLTKGKDKVIAGVCSGVAETLNVNPTVVRVVWGGLSLFYGVGILAYGAAALLMKDKN